MFDLKKELEKFKPIEINKEDSSPEKIEDLIDVLSKLSSRIDK